jgi:hypothetical protein
MLESKPVVAAANLAYNIHRLIFHERRALIG